MALSPSIPTSFVPKQPVASGPNRSASGTNILLLISIVVLGIAVTASAGVFLYDHYLISTEKAKTAQLEQAQKNVDLATVQDFLRLRNRLVAAKSILNNHTELSRFFTLLGSITGQNVAFTALQVQVAQDHSAKVELKGTAKTFNALAVESSTFASQSDIKSAIFSGISIDKSNKVGFIVDATLAPQLVVGGAAPATASASAVQTATSSNAIPTFSPSASTTVPTKSITRVTSTSASSTAAASTTKP